MGSQWFSRVLSQGATGFLFFLPFRVFCEAVFTTEAQRGEAAKHALSKVEGGAKETQIRFKMQEDGEPVWDQTTIDRLWVTTQREAMIESGPPAEKPSVNTQQSSEPGHKVQKEPTKK